MTTSKNKERDLEVFELVLRGTNQTEVARLMGLSSVRVGAIFKNIQEELLNPEILKDTEILKPHGAIKVMRLERSKWLELLKRARCGG